MQTIVRMLGVQEYLPVWHRMQSFTDNRENNTPDEIWLCQHLSVFTQGQAGKDEHILAAGDIPIVKVDRGGQVTYHGPGQLMCYTLLDIKRAKIGVRQLVDGLEGSIVKTLEKYGTTAYPKPDAPGVYVDGKKICSVGLRIRKGRSFHGLAFNVNMDLNPFLKINPCGYPGLEMIDCQRVAGPNNIEQATEDVVEFLCSELSITNLVYKEGFDE